MTLQDRSEPLLTNSMTGGSRDYDTHELFDQALASIKKDILSELPEEKVGTEKIPLNDLERGYNIAIQDVRERLERYIGSKDE